MNSLFRGAALACSSWLLSRNSNCYYKFHTQHILECARHKQLGVSASTFARLPVCTHRASLMHLFYILTYCSEE